MLCSYSILKKFNVNLKCVSQVENGLLNNVLICRNAERFKSLWIYRYIEYIISFL